MFNMLYTTVIQIWSSAPVDSHTTESHNFQANRHYARVPTVPRIPLIEDLTRGPVPAGSNLLVEYDATSQWYNASVTIAGGWLRSGGAVVEYGAAGQQPENVRAQLHRLGLNPEELEKDDRLGIYDFYTATMGMKSKENYAYDSLKAADLSLSISKLLKEKEARVGPECLRIWDDASCLDRFNDEKSWVEYVLARLVPLAVSWKSTAIRGVMTEIHSDWVYKRLEAAHDGVIDFKLEEDGKITRDLIRIRSMRNVGYDREWHEVKIGENFEVTLEK